MGSPTIYYGCIDLKPAGDGKWEGGGYTAKGVYGMTVIQKDGKNVVTDLPEAKNLAKYASVFVESGGKAHFFNSKGKETGPSGGQKHDLKYYKDQLKCSAGQGGVENKTIFYLGCNELRPAGENTWAKGDLVVKKDTGGRTVAQQGGKDVLVGLPDAGTISKYGYVLLDRSLAPHYFDSNGAEIQGGNKNLEYYKGQLGCPSAKIAPVEAQRQSRPAQDFGVFNNCDNAVLPPTGEINRLIEIFGKTLKDGTCLYSTDEQVSGKDGRKHLQTRVGTVEQCSQMDGFEARVDSIMARYRPQICNEKREFYRKKDMPATSVPGECVVSFGGTKINSRSSEACAHLVRASELQASRDKEIEAVRREQMSYIKGNMRKTKESDKELDPSVRQGLEEDAAKAMQYLK